MASKVAELLLKIKSTGEEAIDRVSESFDAMKMVALAAFAAISAVIVKSIQDYREQELATNALTRAMVNNGIYSAELRDNYLAQASALQQLTLYGDEQIISAQAVLQGYLGQTKVTQELVQATLDLATAKGMDLNSAAELVGKTIGTETNALARNGIEVTENASRQQRLGEVLDGIRSKWGGQAEAAASGLGVLTQVKNVISDLFEEIGQRLAPVIVLFAGKFKAFGSDVNSTRPIIDAFIFSLKVLTQGGVLVAGVFEYVAQIIGTYLGGTIGAVTQMLEGKFKQAWETAKTTVVDGGAAFQTVWQNTVNRLQEIDAAFLAGKQANLLKEEQLITESNSRKAAVRQEFEAGEAAKALEAQIAQQQIDMQLLEAGEENRARVQLQARIKAQENILKSTQDAQKKLAAQQEIYDLNEQQKQMIQDQKMMENRKATLATIATLQQSSNKELAAIGKAAAITQIAIETPVAIAKALSAFPPPFNFVAAGLVGAAMAAQAANIAGVQLAEGGIVRARPGGIQATIGEGGQDEAVIPLDRAGEFGFGGGGGNNITLVVNGGLLGSETEAREFAIAIDRELLKLRRNNESLSFDSGVV